MTYLDKLTPGQAATIIGFVEDSPTVRRLAELGLLPGRRVVYLRNAPLMDPLQLQIGPCSLSVRHSEAALVTVELET
jgi:ferrous iron transport protein A